MRTRNIVFLAFGLFLLGASSLLHVIASKMTYNTGKLNTHVVGSYAGCNQCSQLAKDIAWSLDNESQRWNRDNYVVFLGTNKIKSVVVIWAPLNDVFDGYKSTVGVDKDMITVGDNFLGNGWFPRDDDRTLLYEAITRYDKRWNDNDGVPLELKEKAYKSSPTKITPETINNAQ